MRRLSTIILAPRLGHCIAALALAALTLGCKGKKASEAGRPPEVQVAQAIAKDIFLAREWVGTTNGMVNAVIRPRVQGYLKSRNYQEGSKVKQGDLLFTIDDRQYRAALDQAKGSLAQAEANLGKSRLDVQKYTPLVKEGAVSQQEFDNAMQTNRANEAVVQSVKGSQAQAALNLAWTEVRSPIAGIAGIALPSVGDLVDTSTQLTTVSQVDPIKVTFPLSESEFLYFRKAHISATKAATVQPRPKAEDEMLTLTLSDGTTYDHLGTLSVADREIDPKTGTILVYGIFPNPDQLLRPGQFAKVRANVKMMKGVILVPQKSIMEVQDALMVAVVGRDNKAELRRVKCGETHEDMRIVTEGLHEGESVVVEGLLRVRHGMSVVPRPSDKLAGKPATALSAPER